MKTGNDMCLSHHFVSGLAVTLVMNNFSSRAPQFLSLGKYKRKKNAFETKIINVN